MGQWLEKYRLEKKRHLKSELLIQRVEPEAWLEGWQRLAQLTQGLEKTDPRFDLIMTLLDQCDEAFLKRDWEGFERVAEGLKENL